MKKVYVIVFFEEGKYKFTVSKVFATKEIAEKYKNKLINNENFIIVKIDMIEDESYI